MFIIHLKKKTKGIFVIINLIVTWNMYVYIGSCGCKGIH